MVVFGSIALRWWFSAGDITPVFAKIEALCLTTQAKLDGLAERIMLMPTRADLDAAKQALSAEIQIVVQHVNELEAQIAAGQPITDQDIQDLKADLAALQGTDPTPTPSP